MLDPGYRAHLCYLHNVDFLSQRLADHVRLVNEPEYICTGCGRVANSADSLCVPRSMPNSASSGGDPTGRANRAMSLLNATGVWDAGAYGCAPNFAAGLPGEVRLSAPDRAVLHELAATVAGDAARPEERTKRELWRRHNDLGSTRAPVFCDPENGWKEIITASDLYCRGLLARRWEMVLGKEIYRAERINDDRVIEPHFDIGYTHSEDDWGFRVNQSGGAGGAYRWEPALTDETEPEQLHPPVFDIDHQTTMGTLALAQDVFGDLLEVRLVGVWWWSLGMTLDLAMLRGLENLMLDMVDRPQLVHRLMGKLRGGYAHKLDFLEAHGLLGVNTDQCVGSGGFGYTDRLPRRPRSRQGEEGRPVGLCREPGDRWGIPADVCRIHLSVPASTPQALRAQLLWLLRASGCAVACGEADPQSSGGSRFPPGPI
jgi:hypothetical protein